MVDISKIKDIIRIHLLTFPRDYNPFLVNPVLYNWVAPQNLEDTLLLEAVLRIFRDHVALLGPIDQDNAEQLRRNILSFLNEDYEFNKKTEEKIKSLKRQSRLNDKLLKQFRDIVNSSEGINFIPSDEQQYLLTSGLGIYQENNRLFINFFYADHSLIVDFLKYISWELSKRKILDFWVKNTKPFTISITVIILAITSTVAHRQWEDAHKFNQIVTLCKAKQVDINCGDLEQKSNKSVDLIYENNKKILKQIELGKLNKKQVYPIAAVVPLSSLAQPVADDMLKAIADKQEEYNQKNESKLFVLIADDKNDTTTGQNIAKKLGKIEVLLGVVGSYSSSNSAGVIQNYKDSNLVLISPTATATLSDLNTSYQNDIIKSNLRDLDTSFFFRPVGTTQSQIADVLEYLKRQNKTKIILFWESGDTYPLSLENQLDKQNKNLSIVSHDSKELLAGTLESMIKEMTSQSDRFQQDSTAILIFQGAYKNKQEREELRKKAKSIIRTNQGHFLVIGSNPVYGTNLICEFINEPNFAQISSSLVIMQPWFPEPNDNLHPKPFNCPSQDSSVPWRLAMSEDATQMLIYAINKASENGDPSREKIQDALMGDEIQDTTCTDKNKGIKDNVLTGNITLNGSDRCNPSSELVRPIYLKDTEQWQWQKIPKPYK